MGFSRCGTHGLGVGVLLTRTGGIVTSSKLCAKLYVGLAMWSVSCSAENPGQIKLGSAGTDARTPTPNLSLRFRWSADVASILPNLAKGAEVVTYPP